MNCWREVVWSWIRGKARQMTSSSFVALLMFWMPRPDQIRMGAHESHSPLIVNSHALSPTSKMLIIIQQKQMRAKSSDRVRVRADGSLWEPSFLIVCCVRADGTWWTLSPSFDRVLDSPSQVKWVHCSSLREEWQSISAIEYSWTPLCRTRLSRTVSRYLVLYYVPKKHWSTLVRKCSQGSSWQYALKSEERIDVFTVTKAKSDWLDLPVQSNKLPVFVTFRDQTITPEIWHQPRYLEPPLSPANENQADCIGVCAKTGFPPKSVEQGDGVPFRAAPLR